MITTTVVWGWDAVWKVANLTKSFVGLIAKPVIHLVNVLIHVALRLVFGLVGVLHHLIADAFTLVHHAIGLANGAIDWIHHSADWLANQLKSFGDSFYHDVVLPAIHDAIKGLKAAGHAATGVIDGILHWKAWVMTEIAAPFERLIHHLGDTVLKALEAVLLTLYNYTIAQLIHNVEWLMTTVDGYAKVLTADALKALSLLKDASWLIIKAAEYTPEVAAGILTALEGMGKAALEPTAAMRTQAESDIDALFKTLL
jgi:hypothetical protein